MMGVFHSDPTAPAGEEKSLETLLMKRCRAPSSTADECRIMQIHRKTVTLGPDWDLLQTQNYLQVGPQFPIYTL